MPVTPMLRENPIKHFDKKGLLSWEFLILNKIINFGQMDLVLLRVSAVRLTGVFYYFFPFLFTVPTSFGSRISLEKPPKRIAAFVLKIFVVVCRLGAFIYCPGSSEVIAAIFRVHLYWIAISACTVFTSLKVLSLQSSFLLLYVFSKFYIWATKKRKTFLQKLCYKGKYCTRGFYEKSSNKAPQRRYLQQL